jgi:ribosomal subunit interface protein
MHTTITVRHTEISDELRARAEGVMARMAQLSSHALESTVVFDQGPLAHLVEIRLHVRGGQILVGHGEGPDHRTALDRAEERVRRQLTRSGTVTRRVRNASAPRP